MRATLLRPFQNRLGVILHSDRLPATRQTNKEGGRKKGTKSKEAKRAEPRLGRVVHVVPKKKREAAKLRPAGKLADLWHTGTFSISDAGPPPS